MKAVTVVAIRGKLARTVNLLASTAEKCYSPRKPSACNTWSNGM